MKKTICSLGLIGTLTLAGCKEKPQPVKEIPQPEPAVQTPQQVTETPKREVSTPQPIVVAIQQVVVAPQPVIEVPQEVKDRQAKLAQSYDLGRLISGSEFPDYSLNFENKGVNVKVWRDNNFPAAQNVLFYSIGKTQIRMNGAGEVLVNSHGRDIQDSLVDVRARQIGDVILDYMISTQKLAYAQLTNTFYKVDFDLGIVRNENTNTNVTIVRPEITSTNSFKEL